MAERTATLSFKITPELKAALETAAADDSRSVSSLVIKVLTEWTKANNHPNETTKKKR